MPQAGVGSVAVGQRGRHDVTFDVPTVRVASSDC